MRIVKGDKVKYLDLEGVAISNPYIYIRYGNLYRCLL